jgi:hypothetical protein
VRVPALKAAIRLAETRKPFEGTRSDIAKDMAGMEQLAPKWEQEDRERLNEIKKQLRSLQEAAIGRARGREHGAVVKGG